MAKLTTVAPPARARRRRSASTARRRHTYVELETGGLARRIEDPHLGVDALVAPDHGQTVLIGGQVLFGREFTRLTAFPKRSRSVSRIKGRACARSPVLVSSGAR
jgi:hypothetical protein